MSLDWSYAGRAGGETSPLFVSSMRADIRSYGALVDGMTDDSDAIQKAIDACAMNGGGVVELPPGKIVIKDQVTIRSSNIILRGAGKNETTIIIPHSLKYYDLMAGSDDDTYSRSKGFIQIQGPRVRSGRGLTFVTSVVSDTGAGYRSLRVEDASNLYVGQWVRLYESDPKYGPPSESLLGYMYSNPDRKKACGLNCYGSLRGIKDLVRFMSKIESISGNTIVLERELPVDVRVDWKPQIHSVERDQVPQNCGIQDFSIEFGWKRTGKHLKEDGNNAIVLEETAFSWVKGVHVTNADLNFVVRYSNFVTVSDVSANVTKDRSNPASKGKQGHIAIGIHDSCDVLASDFDIQDTWWHDLSVRASMLSVFSNGKGKNINMDLHRTAPYMILYDNIYLGEGKRAFTTGGKPRTGQPSAGYSTFYNIRKEYGEPIDMPSCSYGPKLNFVGNFKGRECYGDVVKLEGKVSPSGLYSEQVKRRRS